MENNGIYGNICIEHVCDINFKKLTKHYLYTIQNTNTVHLVLVQIQ